MHRKMADIYVQRVFKLKKDELLVVTCDAGSNRELIDEVLSSAHSIGAKAIAVQIPKPSAPLSGVDSFVAQDVFSSVINVADCWLDCSKMIWIYSDAFEGAFENNPKIRFMLSGSLTTDLLLKLYDVEDLDKTQKFVNQLVEIVKGAKVGRIINGNGTDFTFNMDPVHEVVGSCGDSSQPGFQTLPTDTIIFPDFNSTNGTLVVNSIMNEKEWKVLERPLTMTLSEGRIVDFTGDQNIIDIQKKWLKDEGDNNSYKVAHLTLGLAENIRDFTGNVHLDERLYGAINCGFGHASPVDAPPHGQPSSTHFDCIAPRITMWLDDELIVENGTYVHPKLISIL